MMTHLSFGRAANAKAPIFDTFAPPVTFVRFLQLLRANAASLAYNPLVKQDSGHNLATNERI